MKLIAFGLGLLMAMPALAQGPKDFAVQWPVLGSCAEPAAPGATGPGPAITTPLTCDGAFAVSLDESVYRAVSRDDLADIAAFNADGAALPFGPMPELYRPPPGIWRTAAWFSLPANAAADGQLQLHVTRSAAGDLALDATLADRGATAPRDLLIDVGQKDRAIEAIAFDLTGSAPDFSVDVSVDASEDLQHWQTLVPAATIAQLRQGGQTLTRRQIEFAPQSATYLRVRVLGQGDGLPVESVRILLHAQGPASETISRSTIVAEPSGRDGRAYLFRLPARVPVERLRIALADDNAIASFAISSRATGARDWRPIGQLNAFRLRGGGVSLDNEAMDVAITRDQEWRIEPSIELEREPRLEFSYRPERWLLLTHGRAPYAIVAGSKLGRRGEFPLSALMDKVRRNYGADWQPAIAHLGKMQAAGGEAALKAYDPAQRRTWILWGVLVGGALLIIAMVLRLMRPGAKDRDEP